MHRSILITTTVVSLALSAGVLQAEIPQLIHYQGYVTVNDQPFTGQGLFKFALVDKAGTNTYWSHDGTGLGGAAPSTTISNLAILKGLYSVLLGDRSIHGMTQTIPPSVFADHRDVFLRVWFDDGTNGLQQLSPDTRIASVGFAMVASTVSDGAINSAALAPDISLGGSNTAGTVTLLSGGDQTRAVLDAGTQAGHASLRLYDATGAFDTVRLVGAEGGGTGAQLLLKNGSGNTTLEFDAQDGASTNAGGVVRFKNNDGKTVLALDSDINEGNSGMLLYDVTGTKETLRLTGAEYGTRGAFLSLKNTNSNPTIELHAQDTDSPSSASVLQLNRDDGKQTVALRSTYDSRDGGALLVANSDANNTVELAGDGGSNQGRLILKHSDLSQRVRLDADGASDGGSMKLYDTDGTLTVSLIGAKTSTAGAYMELKKGDGTTTITLDAESNGEGRITTQVLQITGGADLSEQFEIVGAQKVEPGMIVSIDPARPGELRISDRPNDPTVAGVISGAGGVKPGMLMGQHGTRADGRHPVALTGRAFCWVDADLGAIRPGDLITTSATPGHGMKANPATAVGAIVGKAMTGLERGRGLVLVLVSLQ